MLILVFETGIIGHKLARMNKYSDRPTVRHKFARMNKYLDWPNIGKGPQPHCRQTRKHTVTHDSRSERGGVNGPTEEPRRARIRTMPRESNKS